jgi:hypothetical protein
MSNTKHNPNFGEIYCPYVVFRVYDVEVENERVKSMKKNKSTSRISHKLPSILKNSSCFLYQSNKGVIKK